MRREDWQKICYEVAKEHPEFIDDTFQAFSAGVKQHAYDHRGKTSDMAAALSMVYMHPASKKWRKLAKERLLESKCFEGTPFEKQLLEEK